MGQQILATFTGSSGSPFPGISITGQGANIIVIQSIRLSDDEGVLGATGARRPHGLIEFRAEFSPSTPLFFNALSNNENIPKAEFRFLPKRGAPAETFITLENVRVIRIAQRSDEPTQGIIKGPRLNETPSTFEVQITYEGITIARRKVVPNTPYWLHS